MWTGPIELKEEFVLRTPTFKQMGEMKYKKSVREKNQKYGPPTFLLRIEI